MKGMKGKNVFVAQLIRHFTHHIIENRCIFCFTEQLEGGVQHSPAGGKNVRAFIVGKFAIRINSGVHDAEPNRSMLLPIRYPFGIHVKNTTLPHAVFRRETAGHQVNALYGFDIDDAEKPSAVISLMERFIELHSIEGNDDFVRLAAPNSEF